MPVRIYDISKKLGLENKEILAQAKAMGIAAAKVPSSSLDKITAEWLEGELVKIHPEAAARLAGRRDRGGSGHPRRQVRSETLSPATLRRARRGRCCGARSPGARRGGAAPTRAGPGGPGGWIRRGRRVG